MNKTDPHGNRIPRSARWFVHASDPAARLGFTNDPAETTRATAWLDLPRGRTAFVAVQWPPIRIVDMR